MTTKESFTDKRHHQRFMLRDSTYAFLRSPANKLGQILDISQSGLAFSYFSTNGSFMESDRLDILANEKIFLENIPIKTIADFILPTEQPFSQITMRRRSLQFKSLSEDQVSQLKDFIYKYGNDIHTDEFNS